MRKIKYRNCNYYFLIAERRQKKEDKKGENNTKF